MSAENAAPGPWRDRGGLDIISSGTGGIVAPPATVNAVPDSRSDVFSLPLHPFCELFPMLEADELQELAQDIQRNGLLVPVVIGQHEGRTVLIDGKNRRAACRLAGVMPQVRELHPGEDIDAFICSANLFRMHRTKGQCASVAQLVLSGAVSLDDAYTQAQHAKATRDDRERQLTRLRNWRPALADAVADGTLGLAAALAVAAERDDEERRARHALSKQLLDLTALPALFANADRIAEVATLLSEHSAQFEKSAEVSVAAFIRFLLEDAKRYGETLVGHGIEVRP